MLKYKIIIPIILMTLSSCGLFHDIKLAEAIRPYQIHTTYITRIIRQFYLPTFYIDNENSFTIALAVAREESRLYYILRYDYTGTINFNVQTIFICLGQQNMQLSLNNVAHSYSNGVYSEEGVSFLTYEQMRAIAGSAIFRVQLIGSNFSTNRLELSSRNVMRLHDTLQRLLN
ncbi:MAG: hypothetical protein FWE37_05930 [Spirochaetaceae bacterium]|nr:hypothetical protein [Spirochaetaceae bacterium]